MSLKEVLIDELRDLYSAENQIIKAMPKTLKAVSDSKLKEAMTAHLEETKGQVVRLRTVFEHLGKKPTGKHCDGAGYSAAIAMAKTLQQDEVVKLLTETLHEEQAAAKNILSDATAILKQAAEQESEEDADEEDDEEKDPEEKESDEKSKEDEAEAASELEAAPKPAKKTKK